MLRKFSLVSILHLPFEGNHNQHTADRTSASETNERKYSPNASCEQTTGK